MKFSTTAIEAKPGETLHIVLKSVGTVPKMAMAHNFVALKARRRCGKVQPGRDDGKGHRLRAGGAQGGRSRLDETCRAPAKPSRSRSRCRRKPGVYPYLCTFPGHYAAGMHGDLTVK